MQQSFYHRIIRSSSHWHAALAVLFVLVLAAELFGLHWFENTEYRLSDIWMRRHAAEQRPDPDIVVIDIDDRSMTEMQEIAGLWAWRREIHADLITALSEFEPRAVVFDLTFSLRDLKQPKSDAAFSDVLKALPGIYLPAVRLDSSLDQSGTSLSQVSVAFGNMAGGQANALAALDLPHAVDQSVWHLGLINRAAGSDSVLRRYAIYNEVKGWKLPSLPARVAKDLGARLPEGENFLIRWSSGLHQHYPYGQLFKMLTEQRPGMSAAQLRDLGAAFRGKTLVIGASAASVFDHHATPLGGNLMVGADILALAIDNLKNGQSVRVVPVAAPFLLGMILIACVAFAFVRRLHPLAVGAGLLAITLAMLIIADQALSRNFLLPIATPLIFAWAWYSTVALGSYLRERRSRQKAVSLFGRFLNPTVVHRMIEQGETVESLSGRSCDITVLFSDIRGFTTLSETRTPHEIVTLLNRYFERQVEVVFKHGGTLDKFIGDCIMAFWGAPVDDPAHASRAVAAAMEMQDALLAFKKELEEESSDVLDFDVGIGVHSGFAVVGFLGAQRKLDYTAIGDTVNLASRVEGLTKGVARVLVTRDTMLACQDAGTFDFEPHGAFSVKGRASAVELYEPKRKIT